MPTPRDLIDDKLLREIRKVNKFREELMNVDIYSNFLQGVENYLKVTKATLKEYESNTGIITFKKAIYSPTGGSATVTVQRKYTSAGQVAVGYTVSGSTLGTTGGVITWEDGDSDDKDIVIPLASGANIEGADFLVLELVNPQGGTFLGDIPRAEVVITSTDTIKFSSPVFAVKEDAKVVKLKVSRISNDLSKEVTVGFKTINGTAKKKKDYDKTIGTLSWGAGDSSDKEIEVPVRLDKKFIEEAGPDEYFYVKLRDPTAGAIITDGQAEVRIINAPRGIIGFENEVAYFAEGTTANIVVIREGSQLGSVKVDYEVIFAAATETDFAEKKTLSGTLKFENGEGTEVSDTYTDTLEIKIPIVGDDGVEGAEKFSIRLFNPTKGAALNPKREVLPCTITQDYPHIGIKDSAFSAENNNEIMVPVVKTEGTDRVGNIYPMEVTYTFINNEANGKAVLPEVYYDVFPITGASVGISAYPSLSGYDYITPSETLSLSGVLTWTNPTPTEAKFIHVGLIDKNMFEFPDTFALELSNPKNASLGYNSGVDITTDVSEDLYPDGGIVSFGGVGIFLEGFQDEPIPVPVVRTGGEDVSALVPFTAGGTAIQGVDYELGGSVLFFTGNSEQETEFIFIKLLRPEAQGKTIDLTLTPDQNVQAYPTPTTTASLTYSGDRDAIQEPPVIVVDPENTMPFPLTEIDSIRVDVKSENLKLKDNYRQIYDIVWWKWLILQMNLNDIVIEQDGAITIDALLEEIEDDIYFFPPNFNAEKDTPPNEEIHWRKSRLGSFPNLQPHHTDMNSDKYRETMDRIYEVPFFNFKERIASLIKNKARNSEYAHIDGLAIINAVDTEMYRRKSQYILDKYGESPDPYTAFYYDEGELQERKDELRDDVLSSTGYDIKPAVDNENYPETDEDKIDLAKRLGSAYGSIGTSTRYTDGTNAIFSLTPRYSSAEYQSIRDRFPGVISPVVDKIIRNYDYMNFRLN